MRKVILLLASITLSFGLLSCDTDLNQVNPNELTTESYYQNAAQMETAVAAVYANFHTTRMLKRRQFFVQDALSGIVGATSAAEDWIPSMITWTHNSGNSGLTLHWEGLYQGIKRANIVINRMPDVENISQSQRDQFLGEAHFLRAYYYHSLVTLWGDVPHFTDVKDAPGGEPLTSADSIYMQVESDLQVALDNLPSSYDDGAQVGRATSTAARALLGRAHLSQGDYGAAQTALQAVIDNGDSPSGGDLQLVDSYFDNFREETENNSESIFEVQFAESSGGSPWAYQGGQGSNRTFRNQEYGFQHWRNVVASENVAREMGVQDWESRASDPDEGIYQGTEAQVGDLADPRATSTFYFACDTYNDGAQTYTTATVDCGTGSSQRTISGDNRPSWKKYQKYYRAPPHGSQNSGINFRQIRYAEVLLGLAEAQAQLGNITSSGNASDPAVELMNQVRDRVGLDGYNDGAGTVSSQQEAMDALYHEFVLEFSGEEALFHFLFRNTGYLEQLNPSAAENKSAAAPEYKQPIPVTEIENNPAVGSGDQNPGF
jgi:hypothetical protein